MAKHEYPTDQARVIIEELLPEWERLFLEKNRKYRAVDNALGSKGVFPDIYRKVGIIKARIWDVNTTMLEEFIGEPTDEVIQDLIGHLFLMLYMRREERKRPSAGE